MGLDLFPQLIIDQWTFQPKKRLRRLSKLRRLRGTAKDALAALGEEHLAERMLYSMDSHEARDFAAELRSAIDRLEQKHPVDNSKSELANWSLDEALAAIKEAAAWYQEVGDLDCDVYAGL